MLLISSHTLAQLFLMIYPWTMKLTDGLVRQLQSCANCQKESGSQVCYYRAGITRPSLKHGALPNYMFTLVLIKYVIIMLVLPSHFSNMVLCPAGIIPTITVINLVKFSHS